MGMMRGGGRRGSAMVVGLLLLLSLQGSEAIWPGKKQPEPAPTATEAAKEYAKEAVRNTADAATNVGESIKQTANAAYETTANAARTVSGGKSDSGETGAGYQDRAGNYIADAAGAVKDNAAYSAQAARDTTARAFDATADTLGSAKERVWGTPEPEPTYTQRAAEAASWASQNVRDGASRAYDATAAPFTREDDRGVYERTRDTVWGAPEPEPTYTQRAADAVRQASQNVRDGASGAFSQEDKRSVYERARDSASRASQATRDSGYRAMGYEPPSEKTYASRAYDSFRDTSSEAYEAGKSRLGSIVEILGWSRVPEDDHNHGPMTASLGNFHSPYDVMVGSTRYVWGKRPEEPKSSYESAKDAVAEKASSAANSMTKAKEATVESAGRASESVKEVVSAGAAAVGADQLVKDGFFRKVWRFVHLLTWGVALGTAVWMTFMSTRLLQQNMPREQFRTVQTKLFPSYLRFLTAGEAALAFLYFFLSNSSKWQTFDLLFLAGATAYNAYVLEPKTTKIYLDRLRLEKEEGRGLDFGDNVSEELNEKNKKFKELHGYSATLNLMSLAGLTYHAWNMVTRVYV